MFKCRAKFRVDSVSTYRMTPNSVLPSLTPVSELYCEEIHSGDMKCTYYGNDLSLLFNQNRLSESVGIDTIKVWLASLAPRSVSHDTSGLSDDALLGMIKSRHIQSQGELLAWSQYLSTLASDEIQNFLDSQKSNEPVQEPVQEPVSNPQNS